MHYCGCDVRLHSVVAVSDEDEVPVISDSSSWASLYRPLAPTLVDPNEAPTEVAPSIPVVEEGETPSVPETPHLQPEDGALPPADTAAGIATRIEGREVMTQTPPLLSRLIQGYLDQTGIEACPSHQMDHGVRDPHCDHCKRALGPLYHHKIVGNRHAVLCTKKNCATPAQSEYGSIPSCCSLVSWPYEIALGVWRRESSDICCFALPSVLF